MKKVVIAIVLSVVLAAGTAFADHPGGWGVGVLGTFGWTHSDGGGVIGGGAALSLKVPVLPIYWGVDLDFGDGYFGLGVTGDWYLIDANLIDTFFGWYFGVGLFGGVRIWDPGFGLNVGGRLPIGLSLQFPVSSLTLEFFLAVVPRLGLGMIFVNDHSNADLYFRVGGEFGFRLWF